MGKVPQDGENCGKILLPPQRTWGGTGGGHCRGDNAANGGSPLHKLEADKAALAQEKARLRAFLREDDPQPLPAAEMEPLLLHL